MYWGGGFQVFFEPLSKCSWGLLNISFITFHPVTFVSIYDPTLWWWGLCLWSHLEAVDGLPPIKDTCILCFLHTFWRLSLRPLVYGTTMWCLWLLGVVLDEVLVPVMLLTGMVWALLFIFILFKAHIEYLHLDETSCRCSTLCSSCGLEHTALVLWSSVLTTLYLAETGRWVSQCRY